MVVALFYYLSATNIDVTSLTWGGRKCSVREVEGCLLGHGFEKFFFADEHAVVSLCFAIPFLHVPFYMVKIDIENFFRRSKRRFEVLLLEETNALRHFRRARWDVLVPRFLHCFSGCVFAQKRWSIQPFSSDLLKIDGLKEWKKWNQFNEEMAKTSLN